MNPTNMEVNTNTWGWEAIYFYLVSDNSIRKTMDVDNHVELPLFNHFGPTIPAISYSNLVRLLSYWSIETFRESLPKVNTSVTKFIEHQNHEAIEDSSCNSLSQARILL